MLEHYLESATRELETLIELTAMDIEDIKRARHESMFERIRTKEHALVAFESNKTLIDRSIAQIVEKNPNSDLEKLLPERTKEQLTGLREKLETLQELNRHYARFVITVGEFYNALYEEMLPIEKDGYHGKNAKLAALIEVRA